MTSKRPPLRLRVGNWYQTRDREYVFKIIARDRIGGYAFAIIPIDGRRLGWRDCGGAWTLGSHPMDLTRQVKITRRGRTK